MLYGVSYYFEYQPMDRLAEDVAMMAAAKINYARIGDSIWSLSEPVEGEIDLDWLERVLDALHQAGIKVIITTPTYAIPPWLHRRHPEVMALRADGTPTPYGGRQNVDLTNPTYRWYAERTTRRLLERYAGHPSVIGFQVDNETGTMGAQNPAVVDAFTEHLKRTYGSVDVINELWGLTYWSHRLGDWADLWPPAGNTSPGYDLAWRRFQAKITTDFLAWQVGIVREYARDDQFVIHDVVGFHGRSDADRYAIGNLMDVVAENFPHATQDGLAHPPVDDLAMYPARTTGSGAVQLYHRSDLAYGVKRSNFLITEMNPISIAGSDNVFPCYDGQWRMAAFSTISRGADMVAYWHWHSLHYGHEIYSHGILNHDLEPNRNYDEVASIGRDLERHGDLLTGLTPEAEVAFLYSYDSRWAMACQPPLKTTDGSAGDERSYERIFDTFYRGFFDARAQSIVLPAGADPADYPVVVAPALYSATDDQLSGLARYAEQGGHLVITIRTGYADQHARARWVRAPGPLREAAGVGYTLYSNLAKPLPVVGTAGFPCPEGVQAHAWMDELVVEDEATEVLATYDHPHFGRFPAITSHPYGKGRVTYVGTVPDAALARAIGDWVLRSAGVTPLGDGLPEPVRFTRARARDGRTLNFLSNWSFEPQRLPTGLVTGTELFSGDPAEALELGPWDFKIVG
jgi:beta-galactosidase